MTLSEELSWRGFVNQTTYKDIKVLDDEKLTFYFGVDPSASSMTIGQLSVLIMISYFIRAGHKPVLLIGGATGLIGDPDGKNEERELKSSEEVSTNKQAIVKEYKKILNNVDFEVVDNLDWFKGINYLDFLRDIGKHVPMRQMLGREFVQSRLGESGSGISYAEFSYSLIQGYDFLHLFKQKGVTLQVCGADQWGNSIAGVELIRRVEGKEANIFSAPLVINKSTGVKFGKSEEGAIWLDEKLTSVYQFYQFWLNVDDAGVEDYLKVYTLLDKPTIDKLMSDFNVDKSSRLAQKTLAYEVTKTVHGTERADSVKRQTEVLFGGGEYSKLNKDDLESLTKELPTVVGSDLINTLVEGGLASSNTEARRFITDGAVSINGNKINPDKVTIEPTDLIHGYAIIKRGKNSLAMARL